MTPEDMKNQLRLFRNEMGVGQTIKCANNCGEDINTDEFIDEFAEALHRNNMEIVDELSEMIDKDPQEVNNDPQFTYYITNDDTLYCPDCA